MAEPDDIDLAVRIVPKGANGTVRLAVDFDGVRPPTLLFADLEMIGWHVAAPPPPPREAIDWTRPDHETGQRFSLTSWQVVGHVVDPPTGSARGGAWSHDETKPFMSTLNGVLRRHGLGDERPAPPVEHRHTPIPFAVTTGPPPSTAVTPVSPAPESAAPVSTAPASPILKAVEDPDEVEPHATIALIIDPTRRGLVQDELDCTPVVDAVWIEAERTMTQVYRGSTYERSVPALRLEVDVTPDEVRLVAPALAAAAGIALEDATRFEVHLPGASDRPAVVTTTPEADRATTDSPTGGLRTA